MSLLFCRRLRVVCSLSLLCMKRCAAAAILKEEGDCVLIEGVPVQFLPAYNALLEEALKEAQQIVYDRA